MNNTPIKPRAELECPMAPMKRSTRSYRRKHYVNNGTPTNPKAALECPMAPKKRKSGQIIETKPKCARNLFESPVAIGLPSTSRQLVEEVNPFVPALTNEQKEEFQKEIDELLVNTDSEDESYASLEALEINIDKSEEAIPLS